MFRLPRAALFAAFITVLSAADAAPASAANATPIDNRAIVAAHAPTIDELRPDNNLLLLRAGVFDPQAQRLDLSSTGARPVQPGNYAIVQFKEGMLNQKRKLEERGVVFLGYIPNNAFQVRLNAVSLDSIRSEPSVRFADAYESGYKLDPALWTAARNSNNALPRDASGAYRIQVFGFAGESVPQLVKALRKSVPDLQVESITDRQDAPSLRVQVKAADVAELLAAASATEGIAWVTPYYEPRLMNSGSIGTIQGNFSTTCSGTSVTVCGPTPLWDHNLFGSGQIVAIGDSGLDANEAWFTTLDKGLGPHTEVTLSDSPIPPAIGVTHPDNKIYAYWVQPGATAFDNNATCPGGSPTSFHGTHTSGTIVGDAAGVFASTFIASTPTSAGHDPADGMAPNAQLMFQDIGNDTTGCLSGLGDLRATLQQAYTGGARIHSDSWGSADAGVYSGEDTNVDYALSLQEDMIFTVSAGNSGPTAQSTGSPGNAKNAITVGALGHAGVTTIAGFSSRGPTVDGRLKPDVMAPGSAVISASGDATTNTTPEAPLSKGLSGTSMAAPTIAGNAALMRQFFTDGFYPRGSKTAADTLNPSGMVMKAVLLNSTNPFIDTNFGGNDFGWGRAYLDSNLWFASTLTGGNDARRLRLFERTNATGLQTGEVTEYTISNVQAGQELRATLTWYDVEGALGAALSLVNNLDLEVVDPSSAVFKGNVFTAGVSTTGGTADSKNTVEQVRIKVPAAGSYTFRVKAINIPGNGRINTARQGYGLAVSAAFALPDPTPFPAPTISGIAEDNFAGIKVAFSATAGAQGFQLYRANGTCAMAVPGDFRLVATGAASPLNDDRSQGGYTYAYKVRGIQNDVEGVASNCVDVVSNDSCTLQPAFSEASIQRDQQNATCGIGLNWSPASALCPAASGITYTVYRDTNPYLTSAVILASGVTGTSITDTAITSGQPYYYGIKATDGVGNQSFRTRTINATALGPDGADGTTFLDDVDTHSYMELQGDWRITNTAASAGTFSYHNAGDGQTYNSNNCSTMITPPILVQPGASLSFKARYDMEFQWDGIVMEISTDGGTIWNDLPPTGGYPSTFAQTGNPPGNVCGYAASHGAFNGVTTASSNADPGNGTAVAVFKPFSANLASFAGQTVKIRWRFSSDSGAEFNGAYIDEISLGGTITDRIFADAFESSASLTCH